MAKILKFCSPALVSLATRCIYHFASSTPNSFRLLTLIILVKFMHQATAKATAAVAATNTNVEAEVCQKFNDATMENLYTVSSNFINLNSTRTSAAATANCDLITYVTHLTTSRSYMLELQAQHWLGPMSIVFYGTADEADNLTRTVLASPVLSTRPNIAYHHVPRRTEPELHPSNILRNIALRQVHTPYATTVDIDFLPRPGMCERLQTFLLRKKTRGGVAHPTDKVAYILPSFSEYFADRDEFIRQFPADKASLKKLWNSSASVFGVFAGDYYPLQGATDFKRWKSATRPYKIQYQTSFEPVYLYRPQTEEEVAKSIASVLPENFTVQTMYFPHLLGHRDYRLFSALTLALLGYQMIVLPNEYMIHVQHEQSEAKKNKDKYLSCEADSFEKYYQHQFNLCAAQQKIDPELYKQNLISLC